MTPEEQAARESEIRDRWQRQHAIREAMRAKGVEPTSSWYDEDIPWLLAALRTAREEGIRMAADQVAGYQGYTSGRCQPKDIAEALRARAQEQP